jgi:hypothetical protein
MLQEYNLPGCLLNVAAHSVLGRTTNTSLPLHCSRYMRESFGGLWYVRARNGVRRSLTQLTSFMN